MSWFLAIRRPHQRKRTWRSGFLSSLADINFVSLIAKPSIAANPCTHKMNVFAHWWLAQTNQSLAYRMLSIAADTGHTADADAWAASVLAWAHRRGLASGSLPVLAAQIAALPGHAPDPSELRRMAVALDKASKSLSTTQPVPMKTEQAARDAFNRPAHWSLMADGRLAPNISRLHGESASSWLLLTAKFGSQLAQSMFDACVRGGAMAVIKVMDSAGSSKRLSLRDLAGLQQVAHYSNAQPEWTQPLGEHILHDSMHVFGAYGVSEIEEQMGDRFIQLLLTPLFSVEYGGNFELPAVTGNDAPMAIDLARPLGEQPEAVSGLHSLIVDKFNLAPGQRFRSVVERAFFSRQPVEMFMADLIHDWSGTSAAQCARRAEQILDAHGLLVHLDPASRARVLHTIYGADTPGSLERSVGLIGLARDAQFQRTLVDWIRFRLAPVVAIESNDWLIPFNDFKSRAADVIAAGMMLERAAPGSLVAAPINTPPGISDSAKGIEGLNVREVYPTIRMEVRRALGLSL
jgi:hypothetical protein